MQQIFGVHIIKFKKMKIYLQKEKVSDILLKYHEFIFDHHSLVPTDMPGMELAVMGVVMAKPNVVPSPSE